MYKLKSQLVNYIDVLRQGQLSKIEMLQPLQIFIVYYCLFISKIHALQFGFYVSSPNQYINGKFISFGTINERTSSKIQSEMKDFMKYYLDAEIHRRHITSEERQSFITTPTKLLEVKGRHILLELDEEISVFLSLLRFSCQGLSRGSSTSSTWTHAEFFINPILVIDIDGSDSLDDYNNKTEITLTEPHIMEADDAIFDHVIRKESSIVSSVNEEVEVCKRDYIPDSDRNCCSCKCVIS